jgi:hypothetical protein
MWDIIKIENRHYTSQKVGFLERSNSQQKWMDNNKYINIPIVD